jgi:alkaline phosphatase D
MSRRFISRRAVIGAGVAAPLAPAFVRHTRAAAVGVGPWVGAVTSTSARVKARLDVADAEAKLLVSRSPDLSSPIVVGPARAAATSDLVVDFQVSGLMPDTAYHYGVETEGGINQMRAGRFRTFPAPGAVASFKFAASSCCRSPDHGVFDQIAAANPLFFAHVGDFHYANITSNDRARYHAAIRGAFAGGRQGRLFRNVPLAYIWDDHDYGSNDAEAGNPGRLAARLSYQDYHAHYPLPAGQGDVPVYQSFALGRVKFIMPDLRTERVYPRTMMGPKQLAWLKQELMAAKGRFPLIFLLSSSPFLGDDENDTWFPDHRREVATFIQENDVGTVAVVAGDAHMLAYDNGKNATKYSAVPERSPIRVFQCSSLASGASVKGGPYSGGTMTGEGQFGLFQVDDDGRSIRVRFGGRRMAGEVMSFEFSVAATAPPAPVAPGQPGAPPAPAAPGVPGSGRSIEVRRISDATQQPLPLKARLDPGGRLGTAADNGGQAFGGLSPAETYTIKLGEP